MQVSAELGLSCVGVGILIVYFTLFIKTMNSLTDGERGRLVAESPSQFSWLSVLLVVAIFFVGGLYFRLSLAVLYCAWTAWASNRQYARWLQQGFDPQFVARLRRLDILSGIGVILLIGGAIASA